MSAFASTGPASATRGRRRIFHVNSAPANVASEPISVSVVQQLARPGALVEVSAVAARLDAGDAVWLGRGEVADPAWF